MSLDMDIFGKERCYRCRLHVVFPTLVEGESEANDQNNETPRHDDCQYSEEHHPGSPGFSLLGSTA